MDNQPLTGPIDNGPHTTGPVVVRTAEDDQRSALARTPITDLSTMSDEAFEAALARAAIGLKRIDRILHSVLIDGAHYGTPKTKDGSAAFQHPILYQGWNRRGRARRGTTPPIGQSQKGLKRRALERLVADTLGTSRVGAGDDVGKVLTAIEAWQPAAPAAAEASASPPPAQAAGL